MKKILIVGLICMFAGSLAAKSSGKDKITEIKLNVYSSDTKIAPNESVILHAEFFGTKKKGFLDSLFGASDAEKSKLQSNDWKIEIVTPNGGVLSKPFLFQKEDEKIKGGWQGFITQSLGAAASKDAVLLTVPSKPGKYVFRLTEGELKQEAAVEVVPRDTNRRLGEYILRTENNDPFLRLAEYHAPFVAQETWFRPRADFLSRFDYDGNWKGDDNWENLEEGSTQAFVYYAVMETQTHWFLHYNFFHPRDYSDVCVVGTCHENDNEGLILTIRKDGSEFGKLEVLETLAHNNVYTFTNNPRIKKGVHNIDGSIAFYGKTHPIVFIEAGGHGVFSATYRSSLFDVEKMDFKQNTGVTYEHKEGLAQSPASANERNIGYELLPIEKELWPKGSGETDTQNNTFEEFFVYQPAGNRPRASAGFVAGKFKGRTASNNMARPFWAFRDSKTDKKGILGVGQWGLDPAYSISVCLSWPNDLPVSTDYVYNPFLVSNAKP